jgi:hypothetical protein
MNLTCRQIRNITLKEDIVRTKTTVTALAALLLAAGCAGAGEQGQPGSQSDKRGGRRTRLWPRRSGLAPGTATQLITPSG